MTSGSRCTSAGVPSAIRRPKSSTVTRSASDMTMPMSCSTRTTEMPERRPDLEDGLGHPVGLLGVHAGDRLVEQQQPRLGAQRPRHLDPLLVAVGEDADRRVQLVAELEELGDLGHALAVHACPRGSPAAAAARRRGSPALVRWWRPSIRFSATDWPRRTGRCSGRRGPPRCRRSGSGRIWSSRCVAEADLALGGLVDAGQDVEHRRLAGAVGADDRVDRAGLDGERHLRQRLDGAEPDADVVDLDRRDVRPDALASARCAAVTPSTGRASCPTRATPAFSGLRRRRGRGRGAAPRRSGRARARRPDSDTSPTSST